MHVICKDGPPVISFVGWSGSGKTTLLEKLIPEFKKRGLRVAVIKHHGGGYRDDCLGAGKQHGRWGDIELEMPGKDTWRFMRAGADVVALVEREILALAVRDKRLFSVRGAQDKLTPVAQDSKFPTVWESGDEGLGKSRDKGRDEGRNKGWDEGRSGSDLIGQDNPSQATEGVRDITARDAWQKLTFIKRGRAGAVLALEDILPLVKDVDLVLAEGFKNSNQPKIEVRRKDSAKSSLSLPVFPGKLLAVVYNSDTAWAEAGPAFTRDEAAKAPRFEVDNARSCFDSGNAPCFDAGGNVPCFDADDIEEITSFVFEKIGKSSCS